MTKNMGCVFMKPFYRQVKTFQSEKELAEEGCISELQNSEWHEKDEQQMIIYSLSKKDPGSIKWNYDWVRINGGNF